jgi:hypothetical protein
MSTKTITKEELDEKIEAAAESHELKEGTVIKILKAALTKGGVNVEYWKTVTRMFPDANGKEDLRQFDNGGKEAVPFLPHPDLIHAFDLFRSHLILICQQKEAYNAYGELIEPSEFEHFQGEYKDNPLNRFKVTGFAISDAGDSVTLTGHRYLRGKATLPLTAVADFHGGDDAYEFGEELYIVTKNAAHQVHQYYHGKYAPDSQYSMDFEEAASDME